MGNTNYWTGISSGLYNHIYLALTEPRFKFIQKTHLADQGRWGVCRRRAHQQINVPSPPAVISS